MRTIMPFLLTAFLAAALVVAIIVQTKFAIASRAISGIPTISLMPEKPGYSRYTRIKEIKNQKSKIKNS